jgi:hypothetical protein
VEHHGERLLQGPGVRVHRRVHPVCQDQGRAHRQQRSRPSLQERYGNIYGYYWAANGIVNKMVADRFLLPADANRLINMLLSQLVTADLLPRRSGGFEVFEQ